MAHDFYRHGAINCGLAGEPRAITVHLPYELWLALDRKAKETNQSRSALIKPFVIEAATRFCSLNFMETAE